MRKFIFVILIYACMVSTAFAGWGQTYTTDKNETPSKIPVRYPEYALERLDQVGSHHWPTEYTVVTKPYGGKHEGVDIRGNEDNKVFAAEKGTIIFVGWMKGYGRTIKIQHADGYRTLYAHLSSFEVRKGFQVKRGQVIGYCGRTGTGNGPHLHFEFQVLQANGTYRAVNPMPYLPKVYTFKR